MKTALLLANKISTDKVTDNYVFDLALSLREKNPRLNIELFFLTDQDSVQTSAGFVIRQFKCLSFPSNFLGLSYFLQFSKSLLFFLESQSDRYDVLHINGISSYILEPILLKIYKKKISIVVHFRGFGSRLFHFLKLLLFNSVWLKRRKLFLIVENTSATTYFSSKHKNIKIIHGLFRRSHYASLVIGDSKEKSCKFGYCGRITQKKGIKILISSFLKVRCKYPKAILYIYGYGDLVDYVKRFIGSGIIYGGGFDRQELGNIMSQFDCFVYPTLSDSFPIGVLEAIYFEKYIIALKNPGISEICSICPGILTVYKDEIPTVLEEFIQGKNHHHSLKEDKQAMLKACDSGTIANEIIKVYRESLI